MTRTKARSCTGKQQFSTRQAASDAMWARIRTGGANPDRLTTYPCSHGPHFHYGHRGGKRR